MNDKKLTMIEQEQKRRDKIRTLRNRVLKIIHARGKSDMDCGGLGCKSCPANMGTVEWIFCLKTIRKVW